MHQRDKPRNSGAFFSFHFYLNYWEKLQNRSKDPQRGREISFVADGNDFQVNFSSARGSSRLEFFNPASLPFSWKNNCQRSIAQHRRQCIHRGHSLTGEKERGWEREAGGSRNTPPFTSPLVLIALRLSVVMTQTAADIPLMMTLCSMPACATTHDNRRKSITPHILSRHGIRTPWIHPSFIPVCPCCVTPIWPASTFGSWKFSISRSSTSLHSRSRAQFAQRRG